jgi:hypothetical protein
VESLPNKKEDPKKRGSKDSKAKEVKPHMKSSMLQKKRMKFIGCWEIFYQKKDRKGITFSYSLKI